MFWVLPVTMVSRTSWPRDWTDNSCSYCAGSPWGSQRVAPDWATELNWIMGVNPIIFTILFTLKRLLFPRRKTMTNLDSILKSRDIALPMKVSILKAMVFPVLMLSCFSCVQFFATVWTVAHQSSVHGILQARILEWVAISFSNGRVGS